MASAAELASATPGHKPPMATPQFWRRTGESRQRVLKRWPAASTATIRSADQRDLTCHYVTSAAYRRNAVCFQNQQVKGKKVKVQRI